MTDRAAVVAILICLGGRIGAQGRHWIETSTETVWRGRFLISLADPGTSAPVTLAMEGLRDWNGAEGSMAWRLCRLREIAKARRVWRT